MYDLRLRLRLMLETRARCTAFAARQSYKRGEKFLRRAWNYEFTSLLGDIQQAGASETAGESVAPCFTLVTDNNCGEIQDEKGRGRRGPWPLPTFWNLTFFVIFLAKRLFT